MRDPTGVPSVEEWCERSGGGRSACGDRGAGARGRGVLLLGLHSIEDAVASMKSIPRRLLILGGRPVDVHLRVGERLWAIGDVNAAFGR